MRDYNAIQFRSPSQKKRTVSASGISTSTTTTTIPLSPVPTSTAATMNNDPVASPPKSPEAPKTTVASLPFLPDHPSSPEDTSKKHPTGIPRFRPSSLSPIRPVTLKGSSTYRSSSPVDSVMSLSPTAGGVNNSTQPPSARNASALSPSDALALRRDYHNNSELYINKLREEIHQHQQTIQKVSSASAKSDAVILELRSTIRQYKRQLEKMSTQSTPSNAETEQPIATVQADKGDAATMASQNATLLDLQQQLQEAHAKIATADLIRKELEDTIEAEQYTWELRVQDLERETVELKQQLMAQESPQIAQRSANVMVPEPPEELIQQLTNAQNEIQHYRSIIMSTSDTSNDNSLMWKEKVALLEQERAELQGCLDEALKELEAVDLELQQDADPNEYLRAENERLEALVLHYEQQVSSFVSSPTSRAVPSSDAASAAKTPDTNVVEQLQHLYRWLLEHSDNDENGATQWMQYDSTNELVHVIQSHVERLAASCNDLQQQLSACKGDLRAKEDSNEEMRNSLKEAVSLLRPLQDTVTKMEKEKNKYGELYEKLRVENDAFQQDLRKFKSLANEKDDEMDQLKQDIESLELQLSKAKLVAANTVVAQHAGAANRSMELEENAAIPLDALDEKRAKRRSGEKNIKELLRDVQLRDIVVNGNSTLPNPALGPSGDCSNGVAQLDLRLQAMEDELTETKRLLSSKRDAERALNKSLKDALGLIKPLQIHLEESEREKRQVLTELEAYKQSTTKDRDALQMLPQPMAPIGGLSPSQNAVSFEVVRELETTVRQLEKENAMLQDALEDMSQSVNASHVSTPSSQVQSSVVQRNQEGKRLRQDFVELQSRYEVTQSRLNDAFSENQLLRDQLAMLQRGSRNQ